LKIEEVIYSWFDVPLFRKRKLIYTTYTLPEYFRRKVYDPYLYQLLVIGKKLKYYGMNLNVHAISQRNRSIENRIHRFLTGKTSDIGA